MAVNDLQIATPWRKRGRRAKEGSAVASLLVSWQNSRRRPDWCTIARNAHKENLRSARNCLIRSSRVKTQETSFCLCSHLPSWPPRHKTSPTPHEHLALPVQTRLGFQPIPQLAPFLVPKLQTAATNARLHFEVTQAADRDASQRQIRASMHLKMSLPLFC